jgi:hypothetical protein
MRALAFRRGRVAFGVRRFQFVSRDFTVVILIESGKGVGRALDLGDGNFPVFICVERAK